MFEPLEDKSRPYSGWQLVLAWLVMAGACIGVNYALFSFVLYPSAVSISGIFRMAAMR